MVSPFLADPREWTLVGGSSPDRQMFTGPPLAAMERVQVTDADWLREYLDGAITQWRERRTDEERAKHAEQSAAAPMPDPARDPSIAMCACYVDAYQSVRVSVFGETLP